MRGTAYYKPIETQNTKRKEIKMNVTALASNKRFQAIAIIEAIKTLSAKNGVDKNLLMEEFAKFENENLINTVAKMVASAALVTAQ